MKDEVQLTFREKLLKLKSGDSVDRINDLIDVIADELEPAKPATAEAPKSE